MTDSDKYQLLDSDREESPGVFYPYYPKQIIAHSGQVEPLVDGKAYFNDLYVTMESLGGDVAKQGIYLINWNFNKLFEIQPGLLFTDYLKGKAALGVDVRVLIWVNDYIFGLARVWNQPLNFNPYIPRVFWDKLEEGRQWLEQQTDYWYQIMITNLEALEELRKEPKLADKALANTLDYPAGSSHTKFALIFDEINGIGYTGGMDFEWNRISDSFHFSDSNGWNTINEWHDIQAKVYGDITQEFFDFYRDLWNELVYFKDNAASLGYTIPIFRYNGNLLVGTPANSTAINDKQLAVNTAGLQHFVQSLRTLPDKNHKISYATPADKFDFRFAPNGAYEIQLAVKKAIQNAETYIYIEDQAMYSREILGYLKDAIINNPALTVILFTGVLDPDVPQQPRSYTIYHYLLEQLPDQSQKDRIGVYIHNPAYVHSKLFLVDDKFALIGSAGMYNRALFVEIEHCVSFVDQDLATGSIQQFRQDLWAEHFKLDPFEQTLITDIQDALSIWQPAWGGGFSPFKLPMWANNLIEFPIGMRNLDGEDIPICLVPYYVFKLDTAGTHLPGTATNFKDPAYWNDMAQFIGGGVDFITDVGLPNPSEINLTGKWIKVIAGPNQGNVLRINSHTDNSIFFQASAQAYDNTTLYRIYRPYIEKVEITGGTLGTAEWIYTFENFDDCGELP